MATDYVKRNRFLQRERDRRRRRRNHAKIDASEQISLVKPGSYYLIPAKGHPGGLVQNLHNFLKVFLRGGFTLAAKKIANKATSERAPFTK